MRKKRRLKVKIAQLLITFISVTVLIAAPIVDFSSTAQAEGTITITEFPLPTLSTSGSAPSDITAGPDGNLWFVERNGAGNIGKITTDGDIIEYAPPTYGSSPTGITTGSDGNIWFTEYSYGKIGKSTTEGVITEFEIPHSPFWNWGCYPENITAGPNGNLWFTAECERSIIGEITPSGDITRHQLPSSYTYPKQIITDTEGNLWFTYTYSPQNYKIGKMTPSGPITEFSASPYGTSIQAITIGSDNHIWFANGGTIGRMTTEGVVTDYYTVSPYDKTITDMNAGADGNVWFVESAKNKVGKISPNGEFTEYELPTDCGDNVYGCQPWAITKSLDGNIWFTEYAGNKIGRVNLPDTTPTPAPTNEAPNCSQAAPSIGLIWPANHEFVPVTILGLTDPDDDTLTVNINSIFQDEPTDTYGDGSFAPDGQGVGTDTAQVRAERAGTNKVPGNGRVYHISYTASDASGDSCSGEVSVGVPHDQGQKGAPVDGGVLYDSTIL